MELSFLDQDFLKGEKESFMKLLLETRQGIPDRLIVVYIINLEMKFFFPCVQI